MQERMPLGQRDSCRGVKGVRMEGEPPCDASLASIFGEASSYPRNEEVFRRPFDMDARAMKSLGDLIPVESRSTRQNYALGRSSTLDEEGRGAGEQMRRKYLPDVWKELLKLEERIRLVDKCASGEEYRYYMLGNRFRFPVDRPHTWNRFGTSRIMEEEEHRKIIVMGKRPEEAVVEQAPRSVLRPDDLIPSERELTKEWELMEEACAKARGIASKRLEAEGDPD